ncbi:LOW QUALITY PROTEIN: ubiquitin carboxyl-terminal hydrolase 40-like [Sarcoramphus papa]
MRKHHKTKFEGLGFVHLFENESVQPIKEKDIEKQFQCKESAYMLFYRKSPLKRPHEARGNPRYQIPEHLLNEMNAANTELQKKRAECDSANNGIDLHLHLSSCYKFHHGALHPSRTWKESVVDLTIDRRKTLGELRQSVFQVFAVLNELKRFIFTRAATTFTNVFMPGLKAIWVYTEGNMGWRSVLEELAGLKTKSSENSERPSPKCLTGFCVTGPVEVNSCDLLSVKVEVFGCLDKICCRSGNHCMRLTVLREDEGRVGSDGCKFSHAPKTRKVHLKDMTVRIYIDVGFLPRNNGSVFIALFYITIFEHLNLALCRGEEETLMQIKDDHFQAAKCFEGLEKDMKVVLHSICQSCVEETNKQTKSDNWHWRRIDWCYEAGEASQENATLKELNVCRGDTLVITEGKLPAKGFLKIPVWWLKPSSHKKHGENAQDQVNGMTCKMDALQVSPAGDAPEYLHTDTDLCYAGSIEIAGEASLEDLKMQAMTLPCCPEQIVPLPSFLRAWTVDSKRPGKLLRNNKQRLNDYKLGARVEICLEALQKEEHLGPQELLLRVQMGIPGERDYCGSTALVWDISKECTTWALRQRVASHYGLPVDKLEIAKYFPERLEWLPISSWTQQMSKRKRKKKQESLQSAPYHLKDGDIIGVKNLLLDDTKDFSTVRDDVGKEKQRQLALGKKKRY